jgi:Bacterial cadherin-like domain
VSRSSPGIALFNSGSFRSSLIISSPMLRAKLVSPPGPPIVSSKRLPAVLSLCSIAAAHKAASGVGPAAVQGGDGTDIGAFEVQTVCNQPPTAVDDTYSTDEDMPLSAAAPGVLGNDSDPDAGDTITAVLASGPSHAASFTLNSDGSFSYTPRRTTMAVTVSPTKRAIRTTPTRMSRPSTSRSIL